MSNENKVDAASQIAACFFDGIPPDHASKEVREILDELALAVKQNIPPRLKKSDITESELLGKVYLRIALPVSRARTRLDRRLTLQDDKDHIVREIVTQWERE